MKHILVMEDGTELSSGADARNAITSVSLTESVNDSPVLSLGSTVAAILKLSVVSPDGAFSVRAGSEATLFRENADGTRIQLGVFILEKPEWNTAASFTLTAYDRVVLLDKDITEYLNHLDNWPYSLKSMAQGVCDYCGVPISADNLPNGECLVKKFSAEGVTGRKLIKWIGQAACRFCRANADGILEFGWYRQAEDYVIGITPEPFRDAFRVDGDSLVLELPGDTSAVDRGTVTLDTRVRVQISENGAAVLTVDDGMRHGYYLHGGFSYADYVTQPIDCVQIRRSGEDVGTVYPETGGRNTYVIEANPLLTANSATQLLPAAETIYNILKDVSYTPCCVKVVGNYNVRAGEIVTITDKNGKTVTAYIMTAESGKGVQKLECAGTRTLEEHTPQNQYSVQALTGKILNLRTDVDGIRAENADTAGKVAALQLTVDGIDTRVSAREQNDNVVTTRMTALEESAENVRIQVQTILDNGVEKVKTGMGYTFDDGGLHIQKSGEQMENRLDNNGMRVSRNNDMILRADASGVLATDVHVRNYLCIGQNARLEDFGNPLQKRTACFFVG